MAAQGGNISGDGIDFDSGRERLKFVLEDLLSLPSGGTASMTCHTFNGAAEEARLIAIKVGALHG